MAETMTGVTSYRTTGNADTFTDTIVATGNSIERASPSVPAAKSGTLTTRTDDDTGVITFTAGHGFATNNVLDVYWSAGGRFGMTATVAGDAVTVDGGSGDNLPVVNTTMAGMVPTSVPLIVTANTAVGIGAYSPVVGRVAFVDGSGEIAAATYRITTAAAGKGWVSGNGVSQPLNTNTVSVKFSHGNTSNAQAMKAAVVFN